MNNNPINTNTTQGTSNAASGASAAVVTIASWALGEYGIKIPPEVSAAMMVLIAAVVHPLMVKVFSGSAVTPPAPPAPTP